MHVELRAYIIYVYSRPQVMFLSGFTHAKFVMIPSAATKLRNVLNIHLGTLFFFFLERMYSGMDDV